jgi:uncharacterized protein (DUF1800 family)
MVDRSLHASRRFGFGRRGSEPLPTDPKTWLLAQLSAPDLLLSTPGPTTLNAAMVDRRWQASLRAERGAAGGMMSGGAMAGDSMPARAIVGGLLPDGSTARGFGDLFPAEMTVQLQHAVSTDRPFRERLVWFWANHFTVAARGGPWPFGLNGAYVHEAIRPHVTGRFAELALAVMHHPAMLDYLNADQSVGPHSPDGIKQHLGLNENLAREFMELHTLGVESGYTQHDVTAFAMVLTGERVRFPADPAGRYYEADMHEPGLQTVLGHTFSESANEADTAIAWIGDHPATRRRIATQLVRHFVADRPPAACVSQVVGALQTSSGDLAAAYRALIDMQEAWQPMTKFLTPAEYVIAVQRAVNLPFEPGRRLLDATADLGQPFRDPILPNGWPDTAADWIAGEALLKRADYAMIQASRPGAPDAQAALEASIGDVCSDTTRAAVKACPSNAEALATVLASPEFMRR